MTANLRVLVVSNDRALLRQTAYLLDEFGYEPVCYADVALALNSRNASKCDFLIVDYDSLDDLAQIEYLKRRRDRDHLQVYLLHRDTEEIDIELAVESGVDDFLRKPASNGEILARLRAGARFCEFQRRHCQRQWHDPLTGLASRTALLEHLKRGLAEGRRGNTTLAVLEIDLFDNLVATRGQDVGNETLSTIARTIEAACTAGQVVAYLNHGKFGVMLPDHSLEKASKWAEQLRQTLSELEIATLDRESRITASVGLAAGGKSISADHLLERAEDALREAHWSGRNCLACHGEFEAEREEWRDLVKNGNPFRSTVARDVMTPVTLTLHTDDTVESAAAAFAQTKLEWLPVVDQNGHMTGIIQRDELADSTYPTLCDVVRDVVQLPDTAPFRTVMDCLVHQGEDAVVVIANNRPIGVVAREQLLALIRCVSTDMFATTEDQNCHDTDFLVVPDIVPVG